MLPKVLIVGTVPYNPSTSSRAFDSYFHNWNKENIRQVFSDSRKPIKGHCSSLYQITDAMMLKRHISKSFVVGQIFNFSDCDEDAYNSSTVQPNWIISKLYKFGKNKTSINRLLRKWLWKKKYWATNRFNEWLDDFKPECVFLAFSDDFFINEIALYVADRFGIPIMCCIGDDYYFNSTFSLSPFYYIYRKKYKAIIDMVFSHKCSAIYISDKIRDKYNSYFDIKGETVYLTSSIARREFRQINKIKPLITYCGNIRLGRNESLVDIANAISKVNDDYVLKIYSSETSNRYISPLKKCKNVEYVGSIPYSKVVDVFKQSDIVIIVEGFKNKDVNLTRYSLSTKAADSIASGCQILVYGSLECGVIEYMKSNGTSVVISCKKELCHSIANLICDVDLQKELYSRSEFILKENHNLFKSNEISEKLFLELLGVQL